MAKVTITVNGEQHEVEGGDWLINTLNALGCEIPHFCFHPGLGPDGNCRMCQVEYVSERGSRLGISCNQRVADGMNVNTNSEAVLKARAGVEEALLLNHPLDCPICDKAGECTLQNYYMDHDLKDSRQQFVRFKKNKALDLGPTLVLDQERCGLCDRCVRFLRDWAGEEQLYIAGRGHGAFLTNFPGKPVDNPYSLNTYDLCPVGALTSKDFRFSTPTWFLKKTPSVCTSCARGCAVMVDTRDDKVYRMRPRHNPHVNGYWMCDYGRLNYQFVNSDRIKDALIESNGEKFPGSLENGTHELLELLGIEGGGERVRLVALASASCTLEEMYALKKFATAYGADFAVARHIPDGEEDNLLRRADRHANARGAEMLNIPVVDLRPGADVAGLGNVPQGAVLLAVGFEYGFEAPFQDLLGKFTAITAISSRETDVTKPAKVVLPGLTFAEKEGLVVNFEGHIQQLSPAFDNLWDRTPPWAIISGLTSALTGGSSYDNIAALRRGLVEDEAAFAGVDLNAVGPTGVRLEGQAV